MSRNRVVQGFENESSYLAFADYDFIKWLPRLSVYKRFLYTLHAHLTKYLRKPIIKLLIDTGSPKSYISKTLLLNLGLSEEQPIHQVNIFIRKDESVQLKDLHMFDSKVFDIILGRPALADHSCVINYWGGVIYFHTGAGTSLVKMHKYNTHLEYK